MLSSTISHSFFFFLLWIVSKFLSSNSHILPSAWSNLTLLLSMESFISLIEFFSSRTYLVIIISISLLNFLFCVLSSWFCQMVFLCFVVVYWASLKHLILNCAPGKAQVFMSLGLVPGQSLWPSAVNHVSLVLVLPEVLHCCPCTSSGSHFLQSSLTDFRKEIPSISSNRDSEAFSDLHQINLLPFTAESRLLIPYCMRRDADSVLLAFPGVKLKLKFVVPSCPEDWSQLSARVH